MTSLLLIIGILCLLAAMHPFTTYPLSLLVLQALLSGKTSRKNLMPSVDLGCAICVCAYNEEHVIESKVHNLLALRERNPGLQILIYVDGSSDRTAEILRPYSAQLDLHFSAERRGKTYGMNLLAAKATAPILIFSDANVLMDLDCVADFQNHMKDPQIGCVCGNLNYTNNGASVTASSGSLYWRFEEALKRLEMKSGSMMGADGSVFAIRRSLRRLPPDHIIDDMYVSLMVLCQGYRVIQAKDARAYEESVISGHEEFKRKVRIACQAFNVHRLIWPQLRQLDGVSLYKYISHKLMRWFTIYFLLFSALAFEAAMVISGFAGLAVALTAGAAALLALGWLGGVKPFAQISDVLSAFIGTGLGVWRSLQGERYQTWTPAASIRG